MNNLKTTMIDAIEGRKLHTHVVISDLAPSYEDYFMLKKGWRLQMYAYGVMSGMGKSKTPMCDIDPTLNMMLNHVNYFSNSIGLIYKKQRMATIESLSKKQQITILFTDAYNIKAANLRARLWAITYEMTASGLNATIVLGDCSILPMLPYEILGAVTTVFDLARELKVEVGEISWFFRKLDGRIAVEEVVRGDYGINDYLRTVPDLKRAEDGLYAEKLLRINSDVRPTLNHPPDVIMKDFMDNVQNWYKEQVNAQLLAK